MFSCVAPTHAVADTGTWPSGGQPMFSNRKTLQLMAPGPTTLFNG